MKQALIVLTIAVAGALAIPPQVRGPPAISGSFAGAQNVPRAPAVPLSHPLPPSNRDGRYTGSSSSSSGSGNYGGSSSSFSGSSSSSNYNNNQGSSYNNNNVGSSYESTNRVSSYAPSTSANTRTKDSEITILRSVFDDNQDGSYSYAFENSDGTKTEQRGYLKNPGTDNEIFVQEGSYQYYGPDGVLYTVTYISDENGYQPSGTHLPAIPNPVRSQNTAGSSSYGTSRPNYSSGSNNNYNSNNRNRY